MYTVQENPSSPWQWRKWKGAAELEWAKVHGGILYNHKWYLLDTQDTNQKNTIRLLLRHWHGLYKNFPVHDKLAQHGPFPAPPVWTRAVMNSATWHKGSATAPTGHQQSNTWLSLQYIAAGPLMKVSVRCFLHGSKSSSCSGQASNSSSLPNSHFTQI